MYIGMSKTNHQLAKKFVLLIIAFVTNLGLSSHLFTDVEIQAQTSTSNNSQPGSIGNNSDANLISPINNQNNNQSQANPNNIINVPNIYPLQTPLVAPVNTENDFGFNFSLGVNTLDSSNVTAYVGLIFQPGRTDSHLARMQRINKETDLLDQQKKLLEAQVALLQQQVEEAKLRVDQIRREQSTGGAKNNLSSTLPQNLPSSTQLPRTFVKPTNANESILGATLDTSMSNTPSGGFFPMIPNGQ